jgi:hypothetical protein
VTPSMWGLRLGCQAGSSIAKLGWELGLLVSDRSMPPKHTLLRKELTYGTND